MLSSSEPVHVARQKEGLLQGLGEVRRLSPLGLLKGCIPWDESAVQFQSGRPGALLPPKGSLISAVNGLRPLIFRLFAFFLLFGLLGAVLALLQFFDWPFSPQVWNGL